MPTATTCFQLRICVGRELGVGWGDLFVFCIKFTSAISFVMVVLLSLSKLESQQETHFSLCFLPLNSFPEAMTTEQLSCLNKELRQGEKEAPGETTLANTLKPEK